MAHKYMVDWASETDVRTEVFEADSIEEAIQIANALLWTSFGVETCDMLISEDRTFESVTVLDVEEIEDDWLPTMSKDDIASYLKL